MFEVRVHGRFTATHQVRRPDGSYEPAHEHDWQVWVTCSGRRLDACGLLVDFERLQRDLAAVLAELDGRHLNDLPAFADGNPSAECVARLVAEAMPVRQPEHPDGPRLSCVEVEEAPGCLARYRPDSNGCPR